MGIQCIALDLDRTTLNGEGKLSQENREAIQDAIRHGIEVVVASGRALCSLPKEILEIPGIRYAITSNGAAVYEIHSGKCLRQYKMTENSVKQIIELTEALPVAYEVFIDGTAYGQEAYIQDPVRFGATQKAISYIQTTRRPVKDMKAFIFDHRQVLDSMDIVEISYKKSGKHMGAAFLLEYLGMNRENLAAFGDGDNDAELLRYAKLGFAVENGTEACKHAADELVPSHDADGVARGIERILQKGKEI